MWKDFVEVVVPAGCLPLVKQKNYNPAGKDLMDVKWNCVKHFNPNYWVQITEFIVCYQEKNSQFGSI